MTQVSQLTTVPACVRGLNSYDAISAMPEGFALILRNFFAQPYGCQLRKGYVEHQSVTGNPETLMAHNKLVPKLYAVAGLGVLDVTTPGGTPAVIPALTVTSNRWQHTNFGNVAGVSMLAVDGIDFPIWFKPDGTIVQLTATDITGADAKTFIDVIAHQKRLWFIQKDTNLGWYLPAEQIIGAAKSFDFGGVFNRGGTLNQLMTWTLDDGNGADDHLAAISTEGEIAIYQGIDPATVGSWQLQGVYYLGRPIGRRSATKYGGDLVVICEQGIVFLSKLLMSTKVNMNNIDEQKYIQQLLSNAATTNGTAFGWQTFVNPTDNQLLINVPAPGANNYQYVMNTITSAWSEFIGYSATCWELFGTRPFFAKDGKICRAWEGNTDAAYYNAGKILPGQAIRGDVQTAFSYLNAPGLQKQVYMVRPTLLVNGPFNSAIRVNPDFNFTLNNAPSSSGATVPGKWDTAIWDSGAVWGAVSGSTKKWVSVSCLGTAAALRMSVVSSSELFWTSTEWLYEVGGPF